jgi:predicted Holliday junction resolvase-like endonuclease
MVMITTLIILVAILIAAVLYLMRHVVLINEELEALGREQHTQNMDIIKLWKNTASYQKFQLEQYKFNEEVAKGFQQVSDRDLVRQLQDIDPTKIGKA